MCVHCADALELLTDKFGDEKAHHLLLNYTSFPFDGEKALKQAKDLIKKTESKSLDEVLADIHTERRKWRAKQHVH